MKIVSYLIAFFLISCVSAPPTYNEDNSRLVVTYNGKEVHRRDPIYSSKEELTRLLYSDEKKYIIFGADWCKPCKKLIKCLKQSGHLSKVMILNLEEPWAARLFQAAGLKIVPSMLVADKNGNPVSIEVGTGQIVMYLIINVETEK